VLTGYKVPMAVARMAWRRLETLQFENLGGAELHEQLDHLQSDLGALHEAITRQYFTLHNQAENGSVQSQTQ
jgi:uncharacterized alpha-E superfamily protein